MYQCQQAFNQQTPIMSQLFPHTMVGMGGLNNGDVSVFNKVNDEKFKKNLIYIHLTLLTGYAHSIDGHIMSDLCPQMYKAYDNEFSVEEVNSDEDDEEDSVRTISHPEFFEKVRQGLRTFCSKDDVCPLGDTVDRPSCPCRLFK